MSKQKKTSKFIRLYGMTLNQIAEKYDMTPGYLYMLHLKGELHRFIQEQEEKKKEKQEVEIRE